MITYEPHFLSSILNYHHRNYSMNTVIRYSFPNDQRYRYMSFSTYEDALNCIRLFKQIDVKAELKI